MMEKTKRLFETDPYLKTFSAKVVSCRREEEGWFLALDQTAFFPEGGGQYGDIGWIDGAEVEDTQENDGVIWHRMSASVPVGKEVEGRLDFEKRFDRMQQHTGEHIFSGLVHRHFGYPNVGFHLGEKICTMDFPGEITWEEIEALEEEANEAIFRNLPVSAVHVDHREAQQISFRSKIEIEGLIRIVTVEGYDVCACCAPHVARTGDIGLLKIIDRVSYKGGVRLTVVCGRRALLDYRGKDRETKRISALLSAKGEEISQAVQRKKEELEECREVVRRLEQTLLEQKAKEIFGEAEDKQMVLAVVEGLSKEQPRGLMNLILQEGATCCGVFHFTKQGSCQYVIGSRMLDVRPMNLCLLQELPGKGGGKKEMVQGSLTASPEEIRAFWKRKTQEEHGRES